MKRAKRQIWFVVDLKDAIYFQEFYDISLNSKECALAGSTAIMAFIEGSTLTIANIGDSRAVLCSAGVAINLSSDHKPDRIDEFERIKVLK